MIYEYFVNETNDEKTNIIINSIKQYLININYDDDNLLMKLLNDINKKIKRINFDNIERFIIGSFDDDDFYCLLLIDNEHKIKNKIFWDFDFVFLDIKQYGIKFNILEWI